MWIHASSVGEVNGIREFVRRLQADLPHEKILVTTMTITGQKAAENIHPDVKCCLLPIDFLFVIKKAIKTMNPELILIAETEIW